MGEHSTPALVVAIASAAVIVAIWAVTMAAVIRYLRRHR